MSFVRLQYQTAFEYYRSFILNEEKMKLLKKYNFRINGAVPSQDWELFAAILTGKKAVVGQGADLPGLEVKSAKTGGNFEYQYHKNAGLKKLEEDMSVHHLFISYSPNYRDIAVRLVQPKDLAKTFESWRELLKENYGTVAPKQRFRRAISFLSVKKHGELVMEISDAQLKVPSRR